VAQKRRQAAGQAITKTIMNLCMWCATGGSIPCMGHQWSAYARGNSNHASGGK